MNSEYYDFLADQLRAAVAADDRRSAIETIALILWSAHQEGEAREVMEEFLMILNYSPEVAERATGTLWKEEDHAS